MATTHGNADDPRNDDILIYLNGAFVPRDEAKVSVFDSGFLLGDGVWEGLRVHKGRIAFLAEHLDRLFEAAAATDMDIGLTREELTDALYETLRRNDMRDSVHMRLMVTRGPKSAPFQDPRLSRWGPTIAIIAEHNAPDARAWETGIRLFTVHVHRQMPDAQDPKLNSHSKLNCVLAMIQATKAGADEALMLDPHGFVNTCNSTNFFIVRRGEIWTSTGDFCMNGITRAKVIEACRRADIPIHQRNYSLVDVYGADEAFVTGTCGGLTPVVEVDGRRVGNGRPGDTTRRLRGLYEALVDEAVGEPAAV